MGWFEGFKVRATCTPEGLISGFGFAPAYAGVLPWPKGLRRQVAHLRQIIESLFAKLLLTFDLEHEAAPLPAGFRGPAGGPRRPA